MQAYRQQSEQVLDSLTTGSQSDFILEQLRNGESLDSIASKLKKGSALSSAGSSRLFEWDFGPESANTASLSTYSRSSLERNEDSISNFPLEVDNIAEDKCHDEEFYKGATWTAVTADSEEVEHLMSYYFC